MINDQIAELVPIDQVNWRRTISCRFGTSGWSKRPSRDDQSLFPSTGHCAAEVPYDIRADTSSVPLTLKVNWEAHKRDLVYANLMTMQAPVSAAKLDTVSRRSVGSSETRTSTRCEFPPWATDTYQARNGSFGSAPE